MLFAAFLPTLYAKVELHNKNRPWYLYNNKYPAPDLSEIYIAWNYSRNYPYWIRELSNSIAIEVY